MRKQAAKALQTAGDKLDEMRQEKNDVCAETDRMEAHCER